MQLFIDNLLFHNVQSSKGNLMFILNIVLYSHIIIATHKSYNNLYTYIISNKSYELIIWQFLLYKKSKEQNNAEAKGYTILLFSFFLTVQLFGY